MCYSLDVVFMLKMPSVGCLTHAVDRLHSMRGATRVLPEVSNIRASLLAIKVLILN